MSLRRCKRRRCCGIVCFVMRKVLLFFLPLLLATLLFIFFTFFMDKGKGALQITSVLKSKVFLNGKPIGETPLCKCEGADMLKTGEYTIRLVPQEGDFSPFEEKIKITKSVLTVVDKTFGKGSTGEGSIITLTPLSDKKSLELLTLSFPQEAEVLLDSNTKGKTPILLKNITDSEHILTLEKKGYKQKSIRIRTTRGYKLEALVFLGVSESLSNTSNVPIIPTASPSAAPKVVKVTILQTPTTDNHLNVRESPSLGGKIISQVFTGETFDFVGEQNGWFEIKLTDGKTGWISASYAKKE